MRTMSAGLSVPHLDIRGVGAGCLVVMEAVLTAMNTRSHGGSCAERTITIVLMKNSEVDLLQAFRPCSTSL